MVVAVGCNEGNSEQPADASAKAHTPSFPEGEPLTWEQWKRQEQPARAKVPDKRDHNYQRYGPAPNRTNWQPSDFLPDKALEAEHVDLCELPLANRRELAKVWRWEQEGRDESKRDEMQAIARRYAKQGVVQAQAAMGVFHEPGPNAASDPEPETGRTLDWLERGAASGTPHAMRRLAAYQFVTLTEMEGRYDGRKIVPQTDFRWDELYYWYWRAAKGFHEMALHSMARDGFINYTWMAYQAPGDEWPSHLEYRQAIREYKWTRLNDLVETLTPGYGKHRDILDDVADVLEEWPDFTEEQRAVAEREVAEFLRENKQALAQYRRPFGCPDMTWLTPDAPTFDWQALNNELAEYDIQVEPAGNRWQVRDEWPPAE